MKMQPLPPSEEYLMLLARKTSGDASAEELRRLEELLEQDPGLEEQFRLLDRYLHEPGALAPTNREAVLQKLLVHLNEGGHPHSMDLPEKEEVAGSGGMVVPQRPRGFLFRRLAVAAAVTAVVALLSFLYLRQQGGEKSKELAVRQLEQRTAPGTRSTIQLPDGTRIWLNAGSRLQYPSRFTGTTRELTLDGEAFFDVARNPSRPFIIHLNKGTIRVLGTSFNVRAYSTEPVVETSVATGKVAFIPRYQKERQQDTFYLAADSKAQFSVAGDRVTTSATNSGEDKAWTEGQLIFRSMLFRDIAAGLERSFGVRIVFADSTLEQYRLTGSFRNNSLEEILYFLSRTKTFHYTITDDQILISK